MESVKGRLEVTTTHVYFFDGRLEREEGKDFKQCHYLSHSVIHIIIGLGHQ